MPQTTHLPAPGAAFPASLDPKVLAGFYEKPDFPQLYFRGNRRRRPMPDDDKEVFALAFQAISKLESGS